MDYELTLAADPTVTGAEATLSQKMIPPLTHVVLQKHQIQFEIRVFIIKNKSTDLLEDNGADEIRWSVPDSSDFFL